MRKYGTVATARLMGQKDLPDAGPVNTYKFEEELETRIAKNLQAMIRIGKPQCQVEREARQNAIKQIILECCKELNWDAHQ